MSVEEHKERNARSKKMLLWFGMIGMFMMFAGLTSAYVVSVSRPDWVNDFTAILTRDADGDRLVQCLAVDGGNEVAIDLADQHHADDLQRFLVGNAEAIAEFRRLAHPVHHRIHLRPPAVDDDAAHADAPQQQHVLRQRTVERLVDRRAAQLHHDRLAGEAPDIGQRLDQDARGIGGTQHGSPVMPAQAGIQAALMTRSKSARTPAFAGVTDEERTKYVMTLRCFL